MTAAPFLLARAHPQLNGFVTRALHRANMRFEPINETGSRLRQSVFLEQPLQLALTVLHSREVIAVQIGDDPGRFGKL